MIPSQAIPILTYGKEASNSKQLSELLAPEYDVVHCCLLSDKSGVTEIPAVLGGEAITPVSNIGSNVDRPSHERRIPRAVVFGGAIPEEHTNAIKDAARKAGVKEGGVSWLAVRGDPSRGSPSADVIASKIRELLKGAGL
ncbi:hypothetical protein BDV97DRAFT_170233 [Delphinella strobiligena]|nr:hypothetical protein BDV97DRAFT_170233 [Delphinella strobiligena]